MAATGHTAHLTISIQPSCVCCAPKPFRLDEEVYIHSNGQVEKFDTRKAKDAEAARAKTIHRLAMKVIVPDEVKEKGLVQFKHVVPYLGKTADGTPVSPTPSNSSKK